MPSELHEEIVDDIRFGFSHFLRINPKYRQNEILVIAENMLFEVVYPSAKGMGLRADMYIDLRDGCGPIAVEVGRMKDGKWSHTTTQDGKPIRVLRVGFDRSIWMLNPRNTEIEIDVMEFYRKELQEIQQSSQNKAPDVDADQDENE